MKRPDFSQIQLQSQDLRSAWDSMEALAQTQAAITDSLRNSSYTVYTKALDEVMDGISVDRMSFAHHAVPVEALKNAGYTTALQVRKASYRELSQIEGMDAASLQKVFDALSDIRQAAEKKTAIRFRVDQKDQEQTALLVDLYRYLSTKYIYSECSRLEGKYRRCIQESLPSAQKITGSAKWLFASRQDQETVTRAAEDIRFAHQSELLTAVPKLQDLYQRVMAAPAEGIWQDFERRSATYYAQLEIFLDEAAAEAKRTGRQVQIPRTQATGDLLPTEIADEVEKITLDTSNLSATLRNYQSFGTKYMLSQRRTLLGDEMGLGKTVQAIGAMAHLYAEGNTHFMVVCPASVLINWTREITKFCAITPWLLHGQDFADNLILWHNKGGVAVTNFESVAKVLAAGELELPLSMLVVDEAHFVKNPQAKRTQNLKKLADKADYAVFMTGTPLENNVDEMKNLIGMLSSGLKGKLSQSADQFEKQACSVYLRRVRQDVLSELPEKTETEEWCKLGKEEKKAYRQQVYAKNFMGMRQVSWNVSDLEQSSKAQRLKEIVEKATEDGRKVLVFSFFLNTLDKVKELFGDVAAGPITGSVPTDTRQQIIDEFSASDTQKVLVCQAISGGTGLNIQSASVVVFCEPQIKPSIETQAIARAYRMGQVHDVLVYRLLADDTVDERIMEILADKQEIFDTYAERSLVGDENLKRIGSESSSGASGGIGAGTASAIVEAENQRLRAEEADPSEAETSGTELPDIDAAATDATAAEATATDETATDATAAEATAAESSETEASASEASDTSVKKAKTATPRKSRAEIIKERYPNGELTPAGVYTVGESLLPGTYFVRVQDSREPAALVTLYRNQEDREFGRVDQEYAVDEVLLLTLSQDQVIQLDRADLVKAVHWERPVKSEEDSGDGQ